MPVISTFYGIIVMMYFFDTVKHNLPHIHIKYGEFTAVISIPEGELIEGFLPKNKMRLVQAWIELHGDELVANWQLAVNGDLPEKIEPLK